ncbi:MAG: CRISPR-associated endonuclease Cas1 [Deferribacteraceae bacterium]|jgi:CRISPR-associated protein Cas1|nr:CRISPR-associated endonuclease Cas1 [Deferribacteraceae bacterium]
MVVYLTEPGTVLKKSGGKLVIEKTGAETIDIPSSKVKAVVSFVGTNVTLPVWDFLLAKGAPLFRLSAGGKCIGCLESVEAYCMEKQALQFELSGDRDFCLAMSKKVVLGKVSNMLMVLRRLNNIYAMAANKDYFIAPYIAKIEAASSVSQLLGYEGVVSRYFLEFFSSTVIKEFSFSGRSKQPALDPFNSLLNFGFFIFRNELYIALKSQGFSPYIGFLHKIKNQHMALTSDLIEEWRALIMEAILILVNNSAFKLSDFERDASSGAVFLTRSAVRIFIKCFEGLLKREDYYVSDKKAVNVREAICCQVNSLTKVFERKDPASYLPVTAGKVRVA